MINRKKVQYSSYSTPSTLETVIKDHTVFVADSHNSIHVITCIDNKCRQVFDVDTNVRSFFYL
jgi:hypothetical protein